MKIIFSNISDYIGLTLKSIGSNSTGSVYRVISDSRLYWTYMDDSNWVQYDYYMKTGVLFPSYIMVDDIKQRGKKN